MNTKLFKQVIAMAAVLSAVGCATSPTKLKSANTAAIDAPNVIGTAALGERVNVTPSNQLNASSVIVASQYTAASGRVCRRLQSSDGMTLPRVVCKDDTGNWIWARNLLSSSIQQQPTQQMSSRRIVQSTNVQVEDSQVELARVEDKKVELVEPEEIDLGDVLIDAGAPKAALTDNIAHTVLPNETLWSFAKRTTGNALNWQSIADVNDIDDARTVAGGDVLQVPAELSRDGA